MIIDVVDLKLETLHFKRRYDTARYRRGVSIYNQKRVKIEKVDVDNTDTQKYFVEAEVEGNYGYYTTLLSIKKDIIIDCSCTCEDYSNGNICKHIIATSMETIEPHFASTKEGRKKLEKIKIEEEKRRLELIKERQEKEKKQREYQYKYGNGLNILESFKNKNRQQEKETSLNLAELYENVISEKSSNNGNLATSMKLECNIEYIDFETLRVSFKIGQTRMYVLSNLSEFYEAYQNEQELYYGKQLSFVPKRENFDIDSQKIFDFILKFCEMIDYNKNFDNYGRYFSVSNKEIYVTGKNIEELLNINKEKITLKTYNNEKTEYKFTNEKLDIKCKISKEKVKMRLYMYWNDDDIIENEEYLLKLNIEDYYVLYSNKNIYVFYKNKIYTMEKDENLINLFQMFKDQDRILIPEDKLDEIKQYVLPQVKYFERENLPEKIAIESELVNELATKILLDIDEKGNILLELKFCYNNFEYNILEKEFQKYIQENKIVRDVPKETEILKRIFSDGFELIPGRKNFIMRNDDYIYDFLSQKIEKYMNDFEVLATDKFKNKQIRQPKISNIGIKVDNGLLELDISKINIDINEIKNVLKDYSIKKKYYKLKNGDFLDLTNNENLELLDEMTSTLDIDYSKVGKGIVNLPISRSVYLEKIIGNNKDINISKNKEFVEIINNMENTEIVDNIKIDEEFEKQLRDYQKVGYKWLKTLEKYKFGGVLADDMGLGKTLQIIAVLKNELNNSKHTTSIVVCPSTLVLNWKAEVEKWCDDIKVLIIKGTAEERKNILEDYEKYDLVITSYDLLKRDIENYENKFFKFIIADEAQYIKNSTTQNATSLKSLQGEIKYALTGTPIENSIAELWSIFDFVMPGYLYSYNKFKKRFEEPILKYEEKDVLIRLKKLIAPFILRRVKKDVLTELPEKNITIMKNEMEEEQEKIYLSYLAQTKKEVAEELEDNSFEKSKFKILMLLTRLRQICCHPSLFIENYKGNSGKLKQCIDLIKDAIESGHKILLFSSYTSMFEIIEKELNKNNIEYYKLVGDTPVSKRIEMVESFNNNENIKIFLISLKSGGTGLNLTSADVVIHYDPWWNISSENQATDRAYRIGQKNSVQVYKLITNNSIEEKINKMQERKEKLSKDLLSTEETFINKLSKEEILDLFN